MKRKSIKMILGMTVFGVLALGCTAFAAGYGGYALPIYQGNNYWGEGHKAHGANNCVYNQVDLLTNTNRATFWITDVNKSQISGDYYFQVGDSKNMYSNRSISSGYVGMENSNNSSTEAYVDGWINFN
ncbi:hypothetical protein [Clostridium cibarium]|uniref:Uncharacterized protein n=1 Tax=Clostridium cibarium TaxID=2762247 RepID=A0ABR8PXK5_9CLOT|nr:hypothetical protein [Clostridium cibarium]MBD7912905.1 hypothetical protein [Clostridium cibarium]